MRSDKRPTKRQAYQGPSRKRRRRAQHIVRVDQRSDRYAYILGAGASHGYYASSTGISPPLAGNFFSTFYRLLISQDLEVKIGDIVNYIRDTRGIDPLEMPLKFDGNIELVFSELHEKLQAALCGPRQVPEIAKYSRTYDQFVFWFCHVLNEIQNGDLCPIYTRLVEQSPPNATFLTFNWDTILDQVLAHTGSWFPDDGYGVNFNRFMDGTWRELKRTRSNWKLLKLHGSTNWLGPYVTLDLRDGTRKWMTSPERVDFSWCLVDGSAWFDTYKDRWRPGYRPYCYFFPPNDDLGYPFMPIIIPPTSQKNFGEHGELFSHIWAQASAELRNASRLVVCGYSFPETDQHAFELLDAFLSKGEKRKEIEVVDPYPEAVAARLGSRIADRYSLKIHKQTLRSYLGLFLDIFSHDAVLLIFIKEHLDLAIRQRVEESTRDPTVRAGE